MTKEDIINSQAFKVINHMIDQKVLELKNAMLELKFRVELAFDAGRNQYPTYVSSRIYEESPQTQGVDEILPANFQQLTSVQYHLTQIFKLKNEINELQQFKCRLTGDWDFCNGNLSDMKAVFGEIIEGMVEK